ncbi:MAG: tetratricopeptide repeat protein [Calditrichaeota bacterium]|nr:MAG: tetratricopeptide repeat protein [Calditrichota bacterium]
MKLSNVLLIFLVLLWGCGSDPVAEGDAAYQRGEYAQAIRHYQEALKAQPQSTAVQEKLGLAYCRLGQLFYQKRHVWRAFEANVEKGVKLIGENPSPETRRELTRLYLALALAFKETPPENNHQKREFFDKTLHYLEEARRLDPENSEAEKVLNDFMAENFADMLAKGQRYLELGKQDPANYLVAEYYLSRALKFRPQDARAAEYLQRARQAALAVPDMDQAVPLAITNQAHKKGLDAFYVVAFNNTHAPLRLDPAGFRLNLVNGDQLQPLQKHPFTHPFPAARVAPGKSSEGVLVFRIPAKARVSRLVYLADGEVLGSKALP